MGSSFSEIQPGIRKFAMEVLLHHWPEWDRNTLWPSESQGKFDHSIEPWPGRDVVVNELLRALREAGMVNGVFRSDYLHADEQLDPRAVAALRSRDKPVTAASRGRCGQCAYEFTEAAALLDHYQREHPVLYEELVVNLVEYSLRIRRDDDS